MSDQVMGYAMLLIAAFVVIGVYLIDRAGKKERRELEDRYAKNPCFAWQYSDQMKCKVCDIAWDVNDPDPPRCPRRTPPIDITPF